MTSNEIYTYIHEKERKKVRKKPYANVAKCKCCYKTPAWKHLIVVFHYSSFHCLDLLVSINGNCNVTATFTFQTVAIFQLCWKICIWLFNVSAWQCTSARSQLCKNVIRRLVWKNLTDLHKSPTSSPSNTWEELEQVWTAIRPYCPTSLLGHLSSCSCSEKRWGCYSRALMAMVLDSDVESHTECVCLGVRKHLCTCNWARGRNLINILHYIVTGMVWICWNLGGILIGSHCVVLFR